MLNPIDQTDFIWSILFFFIFNVSTIYPYNKLIAGRATLGPSDTRASSALPNLSEHASAFRCVNGLKIHGPERDQGHARIMDTRVWRRLCTSGRDSELVLCWPVAISMDPGSSKHACPVLITSSIWSIRPRRPVVFAPSPPTQINSTPAQVCTGNCPSMGIYNCRLLVEAAASYISPTN